MNSTTSVPFSPSFLPSERVLVVVISSLLLLFLVLFLVLFLYAAVVMMQFCYNAPHLLPLLSPRSPTLPAPELPYLTGPGALSDRKSICKAQAQVPAAAT